MSATELTFNFVLAVSLLGVALFHFRKARLKNLLFCLAFTVVVDVLVIGVSLSPPWGRYFFPVGRTLEPIPIVTNLLLFYAFSLGACREWIE